MASEALTMFVVVRKDLITKLNWPIGAVVAQACHASTAVMWENRVDQRVVDYFDPKNIDAMHKIKNESQLTKLSSELSAANIVHRVWREQPENILTCLATLPYTKSEVGSLFKKCQLLRGPQQVLGDMDKETT